MGWAEFHYNVPMHLVAKGPSCVVAYGMDVFQPINLHLEGLHSTLKFNHDGEDLAKKCKQISQLTTFLVDKP